jgi:hypothetical protein
MEDTSMRSKYFIHPVDIATNSKIEFASRLRAFITEPEKLLIPPKRIINENRNDIILDEKFIKFSGENFSKCFEDMRRNKSAEWEILLTSPEVNNDDCTFFSKLFLLNSGDIVILTALSFTEKSDALRKDVDWYREALLPDIKKRVMAAICCGNLTPAEKGAIDFDTPVHTIFGFTLGDVDAHSTASDCFAAEGLDMNKRCLSVGALENWKIFGGWSYSAIERGDFGEEFYFVSMMIRLQVDWFALRRWRKKVLSDESSSILNHRYASLKLRHKAAHEMQYLLQKHQQQTFDFRANLKPWLANAFDGVSVFWSIPEDFEFLKTSTSGLRDIISFAIQERELSQSRIQSRVLYLIAALDTLALTGFVLSLLSFGRRPEQEFPFLDYSFSTEVLAGFVVVNLAVFLLVFSLAFLRTR